jgi:hypothetical protein
MCLCVTRTTKGWRQHFGVLTVRAICVLRAASRLAMQSTNIKVKSAISFIKTSVYNEYSPKPSLKSSKYWGHNALLKQI